MTDQVESIPSADIYSKSEEDLNIEDASVDVESSQQKFLDPKLLTKVEKTAATLAKDLDELLLSIANSLHSVCTFSSGLMINYSQASENLGESVTASVAGMYDFIQKVKRLNSEFDGVDTIHEEIKEIKQTLDVLEALSAKLTGVPPS